MTYHHDKYKSPLRIWLPDNGQLITYQDEPISFRGSLSLKCRQARIKAVTVKLEGKMKVHWSQDGKFEAFLDNCLMLHWMSWRILSHTHTRIDLHK